MNGNANEQSNIEQDTADGDLPEISEQEEEEETVETSPPVLRKSERQVTKPKYLEDYVLLTEEEGELLLLCLNNEPRNFEEAKQSKEWTNAAMMKSIPSRNETHGI